MKHETMMLMTDAQVDAYAALLGIDVDGCKTKAKKVEKREERRERVATVDVIGLHISIPIKRIHDKRLMDKYTGKAHTNMELESVIRDMVGDEQMEEIREVCTDEDGTVDADGYLVVLDAINRSDELKNF